MVASAHPWICCLFLIEFRLAFVASATHDKCELSIGQPSEEKEFALLQQSMQDVVKQADAHLASDSEKALSGRRSSKVYASGRAKVVVREEHDVEAAVPARHNNSQTTSDGVLFDIFIVIPSGASEKERRDSIRATWANYLTSPWCSRCAQSKVAYRFVVGNESDLKASRREAAELGDVAVLENFGQEVFYTKRSEKTWWSIKYAVENFKFKFLLKCDTDSWVFVDRLLKYFDSNHLWEKSKLYAGNFRAGAGATALTNPSAKWYDPVYPEATGLTQYPRHAKGAGYILSHFLAQSLAEEPPDFWEYVPSEDVAVGFWLSVIHKDVRDIPVDTEQTCGSSTVVDHYITPDIMMERWQRYENLGSPC